MFLGNDYANLENGRASGAFAPPFVFTLEVSEPGELLASASVFKFFKLRGGQLTNSPLKNISEGIIGNHFSNITNKLYEEVCKGLERDRYHDGDSDAVPRNLYFSTLRNILRLIEKKRHGGTLIVVPESFSSDSFGESLHIKYKVKSPMIWDKFLSNCINERLYFDVSFKKEKDIQEYEQMLKSNRIRERAEENGKLAREKQKKKIVAIKNGSELIFDSIAGASRQLNINRGSIQQYLKKGEVHTSGYLFQYL